MVLPPSICSCKKKKYNSLLNKRDPNLDSKITQIIFATIPHHPPYFRHNSALHYPQPQTQTQTHNSMPLPPVYIKYCQHPPCGQPFKTRHPLRARYCPTCRKGYAARWRQRHKRNTQYGMSEKQASKELNTRRKVLCHHCGNEYRRLRTIQRYCSPDCRTHSHAPEAYTIAQEQLQALKDRSENIQHTIDTKLNTLTEKELSNLQAELHNNLKLREELNHKWRFNEVERFKQSLYAEDKPSPIMQPLSKEKSS